MTQKRMKNKRTAMLFGFALLCALLSIPFILSMKEVNANYTDFLLALHVAIPLCYGGLLLSLLSVIIFGAEKFIQRKRASVQIAALQALISCEIVVLFLTFFFALKAGEPIFIRFRAFFNKTIYFQTIVINEDLFPLFAYWFYILKFTLIACSILMIVVAIRQNKAINLIKEKEKIYASLGYDYEESDFYKQVHIPYALLQQKDGTRGEFEAYHMLKKGGLQDAEYIFNREVPKNNGLTTELDLVVVHKKGIFVIENKHYTTRVLGSAKDRELRLIDRNGEERCFYNPIWQNERHVEALKDFLSRKSYYVDDDVTPVYSIVVFTAEDDDSTDDIISGISLDGTTTRVCTSYNLKHTVDCLMQETNPTADIDVGGITDVLAALSVRKKTT